MFSFSIFTGYCRSKICRHGLLVEDQHRVVAASLPWMYLLVLAQQLVLWLSSTSVELPVALLFTFSGLSVFSLLRAIYWWSHRASTAEVSTKQKTGDLRSVTIMAPILALFFSSFAAYMFLKTGAVEQVYIAISMVAMAIAGAFSLSVLPVAAITALFGAIAPLGLVFLLSGDDNLILLGGTLIAVLFLNVFLLVQNFRSFADMVCARVKLEEEKTTSQRAAHSVERLAFYDVLTDLPNRRKFVQTISDMQKKTEAGAPGFAIGVIDITGFKSIDDAYGREAGDALLRQVADRLSHLNDCYDDGVGRVARLGGDEFVFVVPGIENVVQAENYGMSLCKSLSQDFELPESKVSLSFSCGFAMFPYSDSDPDKLIARADLARKEVAGKGKGIVGVYSLGLEAATLRETAVRQALQFAIAESAIEPWFQPIVHIENGKIAGFESLARWHDKALGHVSPVEFIEVAEQSQLIESLTLSLFAKSLTVAKTWAPGTKLFFNLSAKLFARQKSVEKMLQMLKDSGLPASQLDIELTETAVMDDLELAKQQMHKFKDAGVGIALDDFGSGYSSLGQIKDLPLDKVKIDKSFTDHICTDAKIRNIVKAIIQLCNTIDIVCVVEGIEDLEQLGLLSDMGCELGQGYLFSKAIPAERTSRRIQLVNAA